MAHRVGAHALLSPSRAVATTQTSSPRLSVPSSARCLTYNKRRWLGQQHRRRWNNGRTALLSVTALKTAVGSGGSDSSDDDRSSNKDPGPVSATPPSMGSPKKPWTASSSSSPSTSARPKADTPASSSASGAGAEAAAVAASSSSSSPSPGSGSGPSSSLSVRSVIISLASLWQSMISLLSSQLVMVLSSVGKWITTRLWPWIAMRFTGPWILALACIIVPIFRDQLSLQLPWLWLGVQHWSRLLFSCFLHTDSIALLVSLLWLAAIARPVQSVLGTGRVIAVAAVSAIVGNLAVFFATYSYSAFLDDPFTGLHPIMEPFWTFITQVTIWMENSLGGQVSDLLISNSTASSIAFANDTGDIGLGCCLVGLVVAVRAFRRRHAVVHSVLAGPLSLYSFPLSLLSVVFLVVIWDASPLEIFRKVSAALAAEIFVVMFGPRLVPKNCPSLPLSAVPLTKPERVADPLQLAPPVNTPKTLSEIKDEYGLVDRPNGVVAFERVALVMRIVLRRLKRWQQQRERDKSETTALT